MLGQLLVNQRFQIHLETHLRSWMLGAGPLGLVSEIWCGLGAVQCRSVKKWFAKLKYIFLHQMKDELENEPVLPPNEKLVFQTAAPATLPDTSS